MIKTKIKTVKKVVDLTNPPKSKFVDESDEEEKDSKKPIKIKIKIRKEED